MNKLDILNREEFVNKLVNLTENISANKTSTSFAINGAWGCGKSFVLDMYEEQISQIQSEETSTDKYFVIRYNCWEYDYYAEPLIAIVSSVVDAIEEKIKLFPDSEEKREIWGMWKSVGIYLLSIASDSIKEKTGIDIKNAVKVVSEGSKSGAKSYEEDHRYDKYFGFNKVISKLHELLENISEQYTVVFLVDELDRCLPEYSIKVLERLHHLTENSKNVITVLSMDKGQLQMSVKQIFGFNNPAKYLKKFIHFEIELDKGVVSDKFVDKHNDYIGLFDEKLVKYEDSIEEFLQTIFKKIDVREQEQLIHRAMLAHKLLFNTPKDYSFMAVELLIVITKTCYQDIKKFTKWFSPYYNVIESDKTEPPFASFFEEKIKKLPANTVLRNGINSKEIQQFTYENSLYGDIAYIWYSLFMNTQNYRIIEIENPQKLDRLHNNIVELKKYENTIKFIK